MRHSLKVENPLTKRNRRAYTLEFKREEVRMVEETDKTIVQLSKELGIGNNLIGRWKRELADNDFEPGQVKDKDAEIRRLQAELRDLKEDHDILKRRQHTLPRTVGEV